MHGNAKGTDFSGISLLDRLLDDAPVMQDPGDPEVAAQERRLLDWDSWREGLRRDMEKLLATRPANAAHDPASRIAGSVLAYGLPPGPESTLGQRIFHAIAAHEPRLAEPASIAAEEAGTAAIVAGAVRWNGETRTVVVKVRSVGDGLEVGIYE